MLDTNAAEMNDPVSDVWKYLGILFVFGDNERTEWEFTRELIAYCAGTEGVDAFDVVTSLTTLRNIPKHEAERIERLQTAELRESLMRGAEACVADDKPSRVFEVLELAAAHEDLLDRYHGRVFCCWSKSLENRIHLAHRHAESPIEAILAAALAERGLALGPNIYVGDAVDF